MVLFTWKCQNDSLLENTLDIGYYKASFYKFGYKTANTGCPWWFNAISKSNTTKPSVKQTAMATLYCITAKPFTTHLMEVDLLEDGKGPADEDGPLDVVLCHVDRLDLLLGAHHGHGGAVALPLVVADAVVVVIIDLVEDGGRAADLVVLEARAEDVGRLVEEGVPGDPGGVLDEEPPFGHAEAERKKNIVYI